MTTAPPTTPCPAGCEDLSIFDETDPNSDITIGTYRASADTMRRDVDAYVTDDYGAGYFEYFDIEFEMEITASDTDGQMVLCAVSNVAASKQDMQSSQSAWIAVYNNAGNLRCEIVEFPSVNNAYFDFSGSTVGKRYFRFRRYRGAFSMYVYSDADRTVLVASKTISGSATNTYRYLNVLASREAAGTATITGYTQCFKLLEAPTTPCPLDSEDLTTYTEVDPGADLNVTASAVEFFALPANLNSYVYYDFGAGNIEDYVINFEAELTYANPSGAQVAICGISNTLGGCNDWNTADDGLQVSLSYNGSQITTMMKCQDNEVSDTMVESGMAIPLRYYTLTKSGTAFTLDIYVDEDRTILLDQLSITGVDSAKRYLFAFANLHAGGSQVCTGYTRCFQAYINPTTPPGTTAAATTEAPTTVAPTTVAPTTVAPTTVAPTTVAPTTLAPTTLAATTLAPTTLCPVECEDLSAFTEVDSGSDITVTADRVTVDSMAQSADSYVYDDYGVDYFGNFEINFEFEVTDSQSNSQMVVICLSNTIGRKSDFISANDGMLVEVYNSSGNITVNIKDYNTDDAGTPYVLGSGNTCDRVWCTLIRDGSDLELNIYSDAARTVLVQSLTLTCETGLKRYLYALTSQNAGSSAYISGYTQCFNIISANFTTAGPTTVAPTTIAATTLAPTTLAATTLAPTTLSASTAPPTTICPLGCEDLTTFTEVDSASDITVIAERASFSTMRRDAVSYVVYDFGASYFGDFVIQFEVEITNVDSAQLPQVILAAVSNTLGTFQDGIDANDEIHFHAYGNNGNLRFTLADENSGDSDNYINGGSSSDLLYITFSRVGTTATVEIYSDSARTVLVDTLTITCETGEKRYLYALQSRDSGFQPSNDMSGYTQCFNIISADVTTVAPTTIAPTTLAPTTLAPTTSAPTTTLTTSPPTTVGPTTEPPCIWNDDMTGTDGSLPDSGYWEVVDGTPQVQSNRFRFVKIGIGTSDKARSTFFLGSGDFEFQIEWDITIPAIGGGTRIRLYDYSYTEWAYAQRIRNASGQQVQAQTNNIPVSTLLSILDASYFGFRRTGNTLVIYGNRGFGDPETFLTDNSFYTGAMLIEIDNWNYAAVPDLTSYWDNFEVITGCDNIDYFVSTAAPTTIAPTTPVPTTVGPTTIAPTTIAPTTLAPTTAAPTTVAGTTVAPVTTAVPTTVAGTTVAPTTLTVTTLVPTTEAPFACVHSEYSLIVSEDTLDSDITDEVTLNSIITSEATLNSVIC